MGFHCVFLPHNAGLENSSYIPNCIDI